MPLKKGKSQSVISHNMSEMMHGPRHAKNVETYGKAKADKISVAAAERMAHGKPK
jgi:hypothetical protein